MRAAARACRGRCLAVVLPWLAFTIVVYLFAFAGGFVATWGRDYTPTLRHFVTAFDLQWADASAGGGLVWAGTAWNSLFTTLKLAGDRRADLRRARPPDRVAAGADDAFAASRAFEFGALLAFAIPGTVLGVSYVLAFNVPPFELTGTGADHRPLLRVPQPAGRRARRQRRLPADRPLARRGLDAAAARTATTLAPRRPAAAQAGPGRGAGLQLRALDDDRLGGDLPRDRRERTGDDLHHRPRRQRRLRRRAGLLHGADRADVARGRG